MKLVWFLLTSEWVNNQEISFEISKQQAYPCKSLVSRTPKPRNEHKMNSDFSYVPGAPCRNKCFSGLSHNLHHKTILLLSPSLLPSLSPKRTLNGNKNVPCTKPQGKFQQKIKTGNHKDQLLKNAIKLEVNNKNVILKDSHLKYSKHPSIQFMDPKEFIKEI